MRIVKEHDERLNEIIDTAAYLFSQKGYERCSVNDILTAIGIAKGTFYHYFKSKEDVLDAVIGKITASIEERVRLVAADNTLPPEEKLMRVFLAMRIEDEHKTDLLEEIHRPENALLHQKSLVASVEAITPILTQIVKEGVRQGVFRCDYPKQYMRIFMTAVTTLMDDGIFKVEPQEQQMMFVALISMLEHMLGLEEGYALNMVMKHWKFSDI